jgi:S1-C subfamily serine protease
MCLGAGLPSLLPFTFSEPNVDLAIISLDARDSEFADELINLGYEPISMVDMADGPSQEGAEVFTVGFPEATSTLGLYIHDPGLAHWASAYFSLPVYSFGRVSMLHEDLNFFWADMSIYPGNSGGPVIENDKLVGIVSGQPTISLEKEEQLRMRIPFGKIIKAKYITQLISEQEKKDAFIESPEGGKAKHIPPLAPSPSKSGGTGFPAYAPAPPPIP